MKNIPTFNLFLVLVLSTFFASVLTIVKLPDWLHYFRPDWLALIVAYWVLALPERLGVFYGFINGLFLDLLLFKVFGVNAFGLATLAFLVSHYHQQLRIFGLWQQALLITLMIAVMKLLIGFINGFTSDFSYTVFYWYSLIGDMLFWPFIYILSRDARRTLGLRTSEGNRV